MTNDPNSTGRYSTASGKTFDFVPGFYDFHVRHYGHRKSVSNVVETSVNAAGDPGAIDYATIRAKFSRERTSVKTLVDYVSRVVPTYQLLEAFADTRFARPGGRALDIGCGRGVHLRLLKGWGYIDEAVGIDVYDHCTGFDESSLDRMHRRFKWLRYAEAMQDRIAAKPPSQWSEIEYLIMNRVPTVRKFAADYGHRPGSDIYRLKMKRRPSMDRFVAGNVFEFEDRFDLVTSFASLDWFPAERIFGKVSSLLADGGFFYVWVTNWWHAMNTTNVFGHFPFAAQRMTKSDFDAYVRATMPEHHETIMNSHSYFDPGHPTLADLVDTARAHGLVPLTWKQNVLPDVARPRGGLSSLGVAQLDQAGFSSAYEDAQTVKTGLRAVDMLPYSYSILFQKTRQDTKLDTDRLAAISESMQQRPRADSAAASVIRRLGSAIYNRFG